MVHDKNINPSHNPHESRDRENILATMSEIESVNRKLAKMSELTLRGSQIDRDELARAQDDRLDAMRRFAGCWGVKDATDKELLDGMRNGIVGLVPDEMRGTFETMTRDCHEPTQD